MNYFTILRNIFSYSRIINERRQFRFSCLFSQRRGKNFVRSFFVLLIGLGAVISIQAQTTITHNINTQGSLTIPGTSTNIYNYYITGAVTSTSNRIIVESGYIGTITLDNVMIKAPSDYAAIRVKGAYNGDPLNPLTKVTIILKGYNQLESGASTAGLKETAAGSATIWSNAAALQVDMGAQIHIRAINENDNNSGELVARSYHNSDGGAGIGGPNSNKAVGGVILGDSGPQGSVTSWGPSNTGSMYTSGGNVIISSGKIYARGGRCGAGIGGGYLTVFSGNIVIYGGDITSYGGNHSAGIGTGCPAMSGNDGQYSYTSSIIALPPAIIKATTEQPGREGLAGANSVTYINDPNKSLITVRTEDYEPNAYINLDLTETRNGDKKLTDIFTALGIEYDLKKVTIGKTADATDEALRVFQFRGQLEQLTTFFTETSSSKPTTFGRPYMSVKKTVIGGINNKVEIVLPLLSMNIAFTDYPSTPLEVGYSALQAKQNAYRLKMEYQDAKAFDVKFKLQDLGVNFLPMIFYASDGTTVVPTPTTLNAGDIYYIDLPIIQGKPMGIYSEILQIYGVWGSDELPSPIRRICEQRVVYNDTDINKNIKVTASPNKFVTTFPTTSTDIVNLTLNINHTDNPITYNPLDVTAKYLVTTEPDYEAALAATPLSSWSYLNIPDNVSADIVTPVSFSGKPKDTYYIHWYVVSGVAYAHSGTITAPPRPYGGFGPYVITDPVRAGILSGNPSVCAVQTPSEIKGEISTGGSGSFDYQWQKSTNGTTWTNVGGNTPDYTPDPLTVSPTYYQRLTTDRLYGGAALPSNIFSIYIVNEGQTLYWKKGATNHNWNDPTNWVDASGVIQNMVPVSCSNVYIPSGVVNYPSLALSDTPIDVYGSPVCDNITFAYGAELAYQQNLAYEKAHVQYNFGYYTALTSGTQPTATKDGGSAISMKREQWYPLAAPLKKMASGDFALGGYPFTWQALADGVSGDDNFYSINFSKANVNNDIDLSTTNNSIAVKVALYKTGTNTTGYNDHKHLQALKGVLEMPYFENAFEVPYHPGHSYEAIAKRSKFYYFNSTTLQQIHNPIGQMNRGNEAYRFVFEDKIENVTINGVEVPCYTMKVSPNSTYKHALIGNPFMATINMKRFYEVNELLNDDGILNNVGYYIYDNTGTGTWNNYSYSSGNGVNSLQAFVVVFKSSAANQTLRFPLEGEYALMGSATVVTPLRIQQLGALSARVTNSSGLGGDYAELSPVNNMVKSEITSDARKLIGDESITPEIFFINHNNAAYNLVQAYNDGEMVVDLGIRCSDTQSQLTLSFDKIKEFAELTGTTPVLIDKYLNVEQDLTQNNTYIFKKELTDNVKNNYTDTSRFSLRFADFVSETDDAINVVYQQGNLTVEFAKGITNVKVYNILGQLVFDSKTLKGNDTHYSRSISLEKGSYVVRVSTVDDKSVSRKIMATY